MAKKRNLPHRAKAENKKKGVGYTDKVRLARIGTGTDPVPLARKKKCASYTDDVPLAIGGTGTDDVALAREKKHTKYTD